MRIAPSPYLLEALRSQSLGWSSALGELIDNAIDASATNIRIVSEARKLSVADDGVGCSDMKAMFTLGDHRAHQGRKGLGRFGIGLKDAALWFWGTTMIDSTRAGKSYRAAVTWENLLRLPEWDVDDPSVQPAPHESSGTRIVFSRIERRFPSGKDLEGLVSDLAFTFAPALRRGVRVVFRRETSQPIECPQFQAPPLEHVVEGDIDVQGKHAHVRAGVVMAGVPNSRSGLHYTHRHRVIIPGSGLGCNGAGTSRLFGWVALGEQWRLSKNKDEVTELKEELGEAVQQLIQPVLDLAAQQAETLELVGLEAHITQMVRDALGGRPKEKERRDKGDESGSVEPKNSPRRRGAVKRQPGNRLPGKIDAGRLRVEFDQLEDRFGIGQVDIHGSRVKLALNHPYVARLRTADERPALSQLALSLIIHHCVMEPESGQRLLPGIISIDQERQFAVMLGQFMTEIMD